MFFIVDVAMLVVRIRFVLQEVIVLNINDTNVPLERHNYKKDRV